MELIDAKILLELYLAKHNLTDWTIEFDRAKKRLGFCNSHKKIIGLSIPYIELNDEKVIVDTIKHEIAHALVGTDEGHGRNWKLACRLVGVEPNRTTLPGEAISPPSKYMRYCPTCGMEEHINRVSRKKYACRKCCRKYNKGRYDIKFLLMYRLNKESK
jgi:predicted SprT family Zn-dependent metalloprotease